MPEIRVTHIEVYPFRRRAGRVQFLALRRAPGRTLGGVWQPVTGKIDPGETALDAARREVREEIGTLPGRWWSLETMTTFYDASKDVIRLLPLFAAELGPRDAVTLSREHDAARFVSAREASRLFIWEAQRRGVQAVRREVIARRDLARVLELPPHGRPSRPRKVSR